MLPIHIKDIVETFSAPIKQVMYEHKFEGFPI